MSTNNSRPSLVTRDQKMISGFQKHLGGIGTLLVGGQNVTPADIEKVFGDRIQKSDDAEAARAALREAVQAERDKRKETSKFVSAVRRAVQAMYYHSPETLNDFGMAPPKAPVRKAKDKAAAAAKGAATRKARHTMGKKQKKGVTGATAAPAGQEATLPAAVPAPSPTEPSGTPQAGSAPTHD